MKTKKKALHAYSVNYREQGDGSARINRGFWISELPRMMLACRLRGHKPVVDGTEGTPFRAGYRWVCCDRCGLRTRPQLELNADRWNIGDPYPAVPADQWADARGTIGGQLLLGHRWPGTLALSFKVGNCGSEHMLAAHISLGPIGALYLHTEGFGTGIQRRLNPIGYYSRVTELGIADGLLYWRLWAERDRWSAETPRWRDGHVRVGVRDVLFGPVRYSYESTAEAAGTVRMPDGDTHTVALTLKRQLRKRARLRGTTLWKVEWSCRPGIPADLKGSVTGSAVAVSDEAVERGRWVQESCVAIAASISSMRTSRGWAPTAAADAD